MPKVLESSSLTFLALATCGHYCGVNFFIKKMSGKHKEVDYHEEGKKLLARVNLEGINLEGVGRYDPLNAVYK